MEQSVINYWGVNRFDVATALAIGSAVVHENTKMLFGPLEGLLLINTGNASGYATTVVKGSLIT